MAQHDITVDYYSGSPDCNPASEQVQQDDTVTWTGAKGTNHWAVVFGPEAPVDKKVLHPGDDTATITANRPGDFHKHKYVVLIWSGKGIEYGDPELIVGF